MLNEDWKYWWKPSPYILKSISKMNSPKKMYSANTVRKNTSYTCTCKYRTYATAAKQVELTEKGVEPLWLVVVLDGDARSVEEDEHDDHPVEGLSLHDRPHAHPATTNGNH